MLQPKELIITSVRQLRVQGHSGVPTVVLYQDRKCFTGFDAIERGDRPGDLKEDLKVQIENDDPVKLAQSRSGIATGRGRFTLGIARDFIDAVVKQALATIERQGYAGRPVGGTFGCPCGKAGRLLPRTGRVRSPQEFRLAAGRMTVEIAWRRPFRCDGTGSPYTAHASIQGGLSSPKPKKALRNCQVPT